MGIREENYQQFLKDMAEKCANDCKPIRSMIGLTNIY